MFGILRVSGSGGVSVSQTWLLSFIAQGLWETQLE